MPDSSQVLSFPTPGALYARRTAARSAGWRGWPGLWLLLLAGPCYPAPADFPEPPELRRDVDFWQRVYTEITTEQGFLHDEQNLGIVYGKMSLPANLTGAARQALIDSNRDTYVALLRGLADKWRLAEEQANLRAAQARFGLRPATPQIALATLGYDPEFLEGSSVAGRGAIGEQIAPLPGQLPVDVQLTDAEKRIYGLFGDDISWQRLYDAAARVRFQLGQSDRFRAGIERSGTWESHIARVFAAKNLPPELAALPHVESSFNPAAYSKVGAAGLWQFMRSTGRLYMRIDDEIDERMDPFRATEAAAQLLAYNYRLLGSWPLAITAYNHGAAGMRRARDSMGTTDMGVIARNYRAPSFGFASRNFYPSFLAVLRIERNPQRFFPGVKRAAEQVSDAIELPAWVPVAAIEAVTGIDRAVLRAFNPAVRDPVWEGERYLPRGYQLHLPRPATGPSWSLSRLLAALPADQLFAAQFRNRSHVTRKGETLARVARRYGLKAADLAALNGLPKGAALRRGTVLRLPDVPPPLWQNPLVASAAAPVAAAVAATAPVVREPPAPDPGAPETAAPETSAKVALEPLDNDRYAIAEDGTIRALGGESLAQIADWLGLTVARLRALNPSQGESLPLGGRLRVEFSKVSREDFMQRRQQWHVSEQSTYFETRRIVGSTNYTVRPGDTLWLVLQKFGGVPTWLLEQYNPNVNLLQLRAGVQLVVPKVSP